MKKKKVIQALKQQRNAEYTQELETRLAQRDPGSFLFNTKQNLSISTTDK